MTDRAHLAALLGLTDLGPGRLTTLLAEFGEPARAWDAVCAGRVGDLPLRIRPDDRAKVTGRWRTEASRVDVDDVAAEHRELGICILAPGDDGWPPALVDDPEPPPLLFVRGDVALLAEPSVAVVGTRRSSALGRSVARELGLDLTDAGVAVVSGLALGIDGAAHRGVLDAGGAPVGVVATGLDVVYPRRHAGLWDEVAAAGVLVSEYPLGTAAERWRFPARNRIIAALADVVVVVESGLRGGSMRTVEAAMERQTDVLAVPGPVRAPASLGTNQLLAEGCGVVRDARDALAALGLAAPPLRPTADEDGVGRSRRASGDEADDSDEGDESDEGPVDDPVLAAVPWSGAPLDAIVGDAGLPFPTVAARLAALELDGLVERADDGYRRVPRDPR